VLRVLAGADPADAATSARPVPDYRAAMAGGARGLMIGLVSPGAEDDLPGPDQAAALEEAAEALRAAGAVLHPVRLPAPMAAYRAANGVINASESFSIHERDATERPELMGRALREKMMTGAVTRAADYLAAQRQRRLLAEGVQRMFGGLDLLLLPGTRHTAPPLDEPDAVIAFTRESAMAPFSLSGHPAAAVPAGFDARGLPRNVQLVAPWFGEAALLRGAAALEAAAPWPPRHPVLSA